MNPKFSRALSRPPKPEVVDRPEPKFLGKIGATIAGLIAAIVLAVTAAGGSYAYLSQAASIEPVTLSSGTAALTVTALTLPTTKLAPGNKVSSSVIVSNTGQVPLALRVTGLTGPATPTALSGALEIGLAVVAQTATCPTVATWTGTIATATTTALNSTVAVGGSSKLCVYATLPSTAPLNSQGATATFGISIDGTQA